MDRVFFFRRAREILMIPIHSIQDLLHATQDKGSRSTILRPLTWFFSICVSAILVAVYEKADSSLIVLFSVFLCLVGVLFLFTYTYCLCTGKAELLRSESHSIYSQLIDKGLIGDSNTGVIRPSKRTATDTSDKDDSL